MDRQNITGSQIRQIRIGRGITVYQLSKALPASAPLSCEEIAQIELGIRKVYDFELLGISKAHGVTIKDLFGTPPVKRHPKQEKK